MEIKPIDKTVKQLLEGEFYKIPRFQRPYSWDRENVEDFWNDAIAAKTPDCFIGSFVVYRGSGPYAPLFVVDGQQRLTTITILLAAIRDAFDTLEDKHLAAGIQKLIERPDINSDAQFVLQTETSYPFFHEFIQKYGETHEEEDLGEEEHALKSAYDFLEAQINADLEAIEDGAGSSEKKKKLKREYLKRARDQLLRLQLILIELTKDDDAYLIFETLNTRGKDLKVSDLLKNHITRLMKPQNKGVDLARDKWERIRDVFESSKADIDINRFLHHMWLSRHQYVGEKELFKDVKRTINQDNVSVFLDYLRKDSEVYRAIFEPEWRKWTRQEVGIFEALKGLQVFRVVQPTPMLLSILRAYFATRIKLKKARSVLKLMENFHFGFTAMTAQRTGGGTGKMYATSARALWEAETGNERVEVLNGFVDKLRERVPTEPEFRSGFEKLNFSDQNTKQKALVRYVLRRIDEHLRKGKGAIDYEKTSIEHIAPQSPVHGDPIARVAEIGNLILVPERVNSDDLANKAFAQKKKVLVAHVPLDPILAAATSWGDDEVGERSKALSELAFGQVFRV